MNLSKAKKPIEYILCGIIVGSLLCRLFSSDQERFTDYKDLDELADTILKNLDDSVAEDKQQKIDEKQIKSGLEPLRLKSTPDVRMKVAYKKNGTDEESTANAAGWATCADSPRSKNIEGNKEKAIELCEEWHKSNTPHMAFGDNSGEFVCKVINSSLDHNKDGESRAKACPHIRLVDRSVID